MLFDDAETLAITEKSGYIIEDGAIKGEAVGGILLPER